MNTGKTLKTFLKTLPLLGVLATALTLTPAIVHADSDDHKYKKHGYSHDRDQSRHDRKPKRHNKSVYNKHHGSHDKHHRKLHHKPKHHSANWRGYYNEHRHNHHRPVYVVEERYYDRYYDDGYIDFDRLRFMVGLSTRNFDITFHD